MTTTLTCPKCMSEMRSYERNRVLVDQCTGCSGLFLDRGELEKLVVAEKEWHAQATPPPPAPRAAAAPPQDRPYADHQQGYRDDHGDRDDHGYRDDRGHGGYRQPYRKKKSFLSDLFDD